MSFMYTVLVNNSTCMRRASLKRGLPETLVRGFKLIGYGCQTIPEPFMVIDVHVHVSLCMWSLMCIVHCICGDAWYMFWHREKPNTTYWSRFDVVAKRFAYRAAPVEEKECRNKTQKRQSRCRHVHQEKPHHLVIDDICVEHPTHCAIAKPVSTLLK